MKKVIAILCSDFHLSHRAPVWRSAEPDWYEAMARPLREISLLQTKYGCLVLFAGDLFDRWGKAGDSYICPELLNWAADHIPYGMMSIMGQHDLPEHAHEENHRSAYTTMMKTGCVTDITHITRTEMVWARMATEHFGLSAFPYPIEIKPLETKERRELEIAITHRYVWFGPHGYDTVTPDTEMTAARMAKHIFDGRLYGYDIIVYGDNHKGFMKKFGKTIVFNCGTLMRRKLDEEDYRPQVGLLHLDGTVTVHHLDTTKDKHLTKDEFKAAKMKLDTEETRKAFREELLKLGASALDFSEAVNQFFETKKTKRSVRNIIRDAMEAEKK